MAMPTTGSVVFLNGAWTDLKEASVSLLDQGLLRGDGLFETIRVTKGVVPFLHEHLDRIFSAAGLIGLKPGISQADLANVLDLLPGRNHIAEAKIRLVFTRGVGDGMDPAGEDLRPTHFALIEPLPARPSAEDYEKGVAAITVRAQTFNQMFAKTVKSTSYFLHMAAKRMARDNSAYEAFLVNANGEISEGSISNIFWVKNGALFTTPLTTGALAGLTRGFLLEQMSRAGTPVIEEPLRFEQLPGLSEVFVSGSISGLLPVTRIDGNVLSTAAGPITRRTREIYAAFVEKRIEAALQRRAGIS